MVVSPMMGKKLSATALTAVCNLRSPVQSTSYATEGEGECFVRTKPNAIARGGGLPEQRPGLASTPTLDYDKEVAI